MSLAAVVMVGMLLGGSVAAPQGEQAALDQMRHFPAYQRALLRVYQRYESGFPAHCQSAAVEPGTGRAKVVHPLQLDARGRIVSGAWTEQLQGIACGERRHYNALVIFKEGTPSLYPMLPGDSYASPLLQHDAIFQVAAALGAVSGTCLPEVIDTALPEGAPANVGVAWNEKWTVRNCTGLYLVPVHFVPDATGTGIHVTLNEIVQVSGKSK